MANKLMTAALRLEMPDLAVDIFEDSFGFCFDTDPAKGKNLIIIIVIFFLVYCCSTYFYFTLLCVSSLLHSLLVLSYILSSSSTFALLHIIFSLTLLSSHSRTLLSLTHHHTHTQHSSSPLLATLTDIIGLLSPTSEDSVDGGSTIQWQSSEEVNNMIKESQKQSKGILSTSTSTDIESEIDNESETTGTEKIMKKDYEFNFLTPNNFVCTTAVKAYGRKMDVDKALAVLPWMESRNIVADTYLLSSLLFVCAKTKRVAEAENIFWQLIPDRNLTYSVATTNSLMYMYAKLNRPDDALKVYELAKGVFCYDMLCYVVLCHVVLCYIII